MSSRDSPWTPADVDQLILASDFEVSGLATRRNQYGLGVPLIGVHETEPEKEEGPERFYPPEMAFPLTAFLVPNRGSTIRPGRSTRSGSARSNWSTRCAGAPWASPGRDRGRDRPDHAAGLHVVAHRPRALSLDGLLRPERPCSGPT